MADYFFKDHYFGHRAGQTEIENLFRYPALAVGLKPSAIQGKARLRGLYRIISSKTISPRLSKTKPACAGYSRHDIAAKMHR